MGEIREEPGLSGEILDYRDKASGGIIPLWVNFFLEGGIAAVERLEEFSDYYVFVSVNSGTNFSALEQWNAGFSPDLDFARLAAVRIENRFLKAANAYPDDEYGAYFVALIRAASDALWEGAVRDRDFWLLRSLPEADGTATSRENYDFFILVKAEKNRLAPQITALLRNLEPDIALTPDQTAAVDLVREKFFDGF